MSLLKQLAGETAIYGLSSILGRLVSWVLLTPFLTRVFAREEFGVYSDLYTYIALLLVLFTHRMETTLFRFASKAGQQNNEHSAEEAYRTAALGVVGVTLGLGSVLFVLAPQLAALLRYPDHVHYVRLLLVIVALDALSSVPFARLRLDRKPLLFAGLRVAAIVLNVALVYFFLYVCPLMAAKGNEWVRGWYDAGRHMDYLLWANIVASAGTLLWLGWVFPRGRWVFLWPLYRRMVHYAMPLVLAGIAATVNQLSGIPLLRFLAPGGVAEGEALAGVYSAAARLAVMMNLFVQAFNYAAEPFFFRQAAADTNKEVYADVARAFALVGSLAFLGIMLYIDAIQYFLGKDFREGLGILPMLLLANYFLGLFFNFSMSYKLTDNTRWGGMLATMGAVITLVVNIVFIPYFGYYAPAWASLLCYFTMAVGSYWVSRRLWPVDYPLMRMGFYLVLALGVWGLSIGIDTVMDNIPLVSIAINTALLLATLGVLFYTERGWMSSVLRK